MSKKIASVANTASAKPGTVDTAAQATKGKGGKRVPYPMKKDEAGKTVLLNAIPTDFDPKVHKPLGRKSFVEEHLFFELRAKQMEDRAAKYRQMAEDSKKLGSVQDRTKAKRLQQMQRRMDELKAQLSAQGVDVNALLASAATKTAE